SYPEQQRAAGSTLTKATSLDDGQGDALDAPALSPLSVRDGAQEREESYFKREMRHLHRGNRTPRWGNPTRGAAVLRRKGSRGGGGGGERLQDACW
ncbi:hypothetical protein PMIN06_000479, partial [Paraphaeosphaeria minitans]